MENWWMFPFAIVQDIDFKNKTQVGEPFGPTAFDNFIGFWRF